MSQLDQDLSAHLRAAYALWRDNLGLLVPVHAVALLLAGASCGVLAGPMAAGAAAVTLALLDRRDPAPEIADVLRGLRWFLPTFLLTAAAAVLLAPLWLVLRPFALAVAFVAGVLLSFSVFLMADRGLDLIPALRESYALARPRFPLYAGVTGLAALAGAAGLVALIVGVFVTAPFLTCALAVAYRRRVPAEGSATEDRPPEDEPPSGRPPTEYLTV